MSRCEELEVLEYWSNGVLGLKAKIDLIFTLLPLVIRGPNMVYIFPLYQPFINPLLQHSRYNNPPPLIKREWLPFTNSCDLHPTSGSFFAKLNESMYRRLYSEVVKITRNMSSKFYLSYIPIYGYRFRVSGVRINFRGPLSWNLVWNYIRSNVVPRSISPQRSLSTQRLFNFFLGDLCDLCGELLCFFSD